MICRNCGRLIEPCHAIYRKCNGWVHVSNERHHCTPAEDLVGGEVSTVAEPDPEQHVEQSHPSLCAITAYGGGVCTCTPDLEQRTLSGMVQGDYLDNGFLDPSPDGDLEGMRQGLIAE